VAARGMPSGRLVTYVPYSPSFETPDEGATNGRLTGIESGKEFADDRGQRAMSSKPRQPRQATAVHAGSGSH
jgi:hypothetical protein